MSQPLPRPIPGGIQVRLLEAADVGEVMELFRRQLLEHRIESNEADLRNVIGTILNQPWRGFILVATATEVGIVGVALASVFLGVEHGGESGWVEELFVLPEWRQQGLGSRLLTEVLRIARDRSWRAIDLEVETDHERALPLYQRHGFRLLSRQRFSLKLT